MLTSRLLTALLAPTGVVAAHALAYGAAHGWEHERQAMLSGHGPFAMLAAIALPLGLAGLLVLVATTPAAGRPRVRQQTVAQVSTFFVAVFVERVLGVQPVAEVLHDPAVWLAVAGQVATAALVVALVRAVDRTLGRCSAPAAAGSAVSTGRAWTPSAAPRNWRQWLVGSIGLRGPPAGGVLSVRS